jgi:hypothetical protein
VVYSFTVNAPGLYNLPPIEMSYFDIESQQYKTMATNPFKFYVSKGLGKEWGRHRMKIVKYGG